VLGGIDPKQMSSIMKKMGIKTEEIEAEEVVIKGKRTIVIKEPKVTQIDMQGQKTFQIAGRIEESEEKGNDADLVMEQTGATREEAERALEETKGDIAEAILRLKKD